MPTQSEMIQYLYDREKAREDYEIQRREAARAQFEADKAERDRRQKECNHIVDFPMTCHIYKACPKCGLEGAIIRSFSSGFSGIDWDYLKKVAAI